MRHTRPGLVLVTGASGFIGRQLVETLHERGWQVRGVVRSIGDTPLPGVEYAVIPDVCDARTVSAAVTGASHVIHAAGLAHVSPTVSGGEFRRVNVDGTRVLLESAIAAGVGVFVFVSSIAAASRGVALLSQASQGLPDGPYGESKLQAERLVRAHALEAGLIAPVLRPAMVYGPGMKGNPLRLFRLVQRGVPLPFAGIRNRRSMVFSGNLAAAVAAVLDNPAAVDAVLHVADPEPISTPAFVSLIADALGASARQFPLPSSVLRLGAAAVGALTAGRLGTQALDRLSGTLVVDDAMLRERLGFVPPYDLGTGVRITAAAFLQRPARQMATEPVEQRVAV